MSNIIRHDPFDAAFEPLDNLFSGFFRPVRHEGQMPPVQMRMDVKEDDKAYRVHAEVPGVKKEDIHITVDGNQVTISAEVNQTAEQKEGEKVLRSERYYGRLARSFALGQDVDEDKAEAAYKDGVLELTLPKKAAAASRRVAVR